MAFRQFHSLFRRLAHRTNHNTTKLHHHPYHSLSSTSSRFHIQSTSHRQHIFITSHFNPHRITNHYNIKRLHHSSIFNLFNHPKPTTRHHRSHFLHSKRFASMDVSKDYYKILGVTKTAPKKDIRSAYLKLAKKWHPDLHKEQTDKDKARNKFIEIQEAYEVLHDDGMRKKYDEMRRYGYSQDQYKFHEAYQKQAPSAGFSTRRGASPWENEWEDQFRRSMHSEWEKIRREQQDWANTRRSERHKYGAQDPFGAQDHPGFGNPRGFAGMGGPGFHNNPQQQMYNPIEGFFRTMIYVFGFFLALRLIGTLLFGPPKDRRFPHRGGPSGYDPFNGPSPYQRDRHESPFYKPSQYERYNHNFPPPLSLREKHDYTHDEDTQNTLKRDRFEPYSPPPPKSPKPRNTLSENHKRRESLMDEDDGNTYTFTKPGSGQTTDISSPGEQRRKAKKAKKTRYEKMLEEQRMVEEVYIRARRKQMEEQEYNRQRAMNKKFGRHGNRSQVPPEKSGGFNEDDEDVNSAWERYLNSKSGNEVNWRDRGRRHG
eukprot:267329_1